MRPPRTRRTASAPARGEPVRHAARGEPVRHAARAEAVRYTVRAANLAEHRFAVEMVIAEPARAQCVSLPVWSPGSYLVREFARHLSGLRARQGRRACAVRQLDKCSWRIEAEPGVPLTLSYEVYAFDNSVRTAWLDAARGFFNGVNLLLAAHGQEGRAHALVVKPPEGAPAWRLATALTPRRIDARGFGAYTAADYDELVDHPVELGAFWSGEFSAGGVPHRVVVAGAAPSFDGARLLRDAQRICETAIRFWHGDAPPPFARYVFMINAVDEGYGGLEHRASTALLCARRDLPRQDGPAAAAAVGEGYVTLLGLISHEYFHAWNVKRLKPAEFARLDYSRENYTQLLWFSEGFTSYYDDLLLLRAGLIDEAAYLKLLTRTANQVLQAPGRRAQSVAQASFDAWVRYYRPDENTANSTISYYSKGALVALCFDLTLRSERGATLDDVMRRLWQRTRGGPMGEADVARALAEVGARSFEREIAAWVHGTDELPLKGLLEQQGVSVREEPSQWAQALGLRVADGAGVTLKVVLAGGAAAAAGMAAGDEWLGIELPPARGAEAPAAGWRLRKLDDLPLYAGAAREVVALVSRDQRLWRLPLQLPAQTTTWRLLPRADTRRPGWPAA